MSSPPSAKYGLLQHVAAFIAAWILTSFLFIYALRPITVGQPLPGYHISTLGKGRLAVDNLLYLSNALREGKTITILGSSELDTGQAVNFIPYVFFPRHHLGKVITYGRAGFEALGIYGLLYAMKPHLNPNSRLVIMLSPGWFRGKGMSPVRFIDNFNDSTLLQMYWSDDPRSIFHDYLTEYRSQFSNLTVTQKMYLDDPSSIINWDLPGFIVRTINTRAYGQQEKLNQFLSRLGAPRDPEADMAVSAADLPWDGFEKQARARELSLMSRNDLWVRNSFYNTVLAPLAVKHKSLFPRKMYEELEMTPLRMLLQMLEASKVNALFVMQPLNPRVIDDIHRFDEVDARIANLCREFHMGYLDMYAAPYEPGVLRDSSHLGELGWERVDKAIAEYYRL